MDQRSFSRPAAVPNLTSGYRSKCRQSNSKRQRWGWRSLGARITDVPACPRSVRCQRAERKAYAHPERFKAECFSPRSPELFGVGGRRRGWSAFCPLRLTDQVPDPAVAIVPPV
jgi:hypothetical protein